MDEGKYTVETFAKANNLARQSAINLLSRLKKEGRVQVSGGGRQKRIYTITRSVKSNGMYDIINKYSPEKLVPQFVHRVFGKYSVENALADALAINDARTREAAMHLFRHVNDWKFLFELAKKKGLTRKLLSLYNDARTKTRVKSIPRRYMK